MTTGPRHLYSLWLEPAGQAKDALKKTIRDLCSMTGTPVFEPHVTLLGGISLPIEEIRAAVKKLSRRTQSNIDISFLSLGHSDSYYRSIFLKCRKTAPLTNLNVAAGNLLHVRKAFEPHLSLAYGNFSMESRKNLLQSVGFEKIGGLHFNVDVISIWSTPGGPETWQKVRS